MEGTLHKAARRSGGKREIKGRKGKGERRRRDIGRER